MAIADDPRQWASWGDKDKSDSPRQLGRDHEHDAHDYDCVRSSLENILIDFEGEIKPQVARYIRSVLRVTPKQTGYRDND